MELVTISGSGTERTLARICPARHRGHRAVECDVAGHEHHSVVLDEQRVEVRATWLAIERRDPLGRRCHPAQSVWGAIQDRRSNGTDMAGFALRSLGQNVEVS